MVMTIPVDPGSPPWFQRYALKLAGILSSLNSTLTTLSGIVSVAGADATGKTDSSAAINAYAGKVAFLAPGTYLLQSSLLQPGNTVLWALPGTVTLKPSGNFPTILRTGSYNTLSGVNIDNSLKKGGVDVLLQCGSTQLIENVLKDMVVTGGPNGSHLCADSGTGDQGYHYRTYFRNVKKLAAAGSFINFTQLFGFCDIDTDCVWETIGSASRIQTGVVVNGTNLAALGSAGGIQIAMKFDGDCPSSGASSSLGQNGCTFTDFNAITFDDPEFDSLDGWAAQFNNCVGIRLNGTQSSLCNDTALQFINSSDVKGSPYVKGRGNNTITGVASKSAFYVSGGGDMQLSDMKLEYCTGDGLSLNNANGVNVSGLKTFENVGNGITTTGTGGYHQISNVFSTGNGANYNLSSANHRINNMIPNSGTYVATVTGVGSG